jgi:transposase
MGSKSSRGGGTPVTLRKRLAQVRACERSGESLRAYAARHDLSVHALYAAKRTARQQGLLPPHGAERGKRRRAPRDQVPRFAEAIARARSSEPDGTWRLRFAGGEVLESSTPLGMDEVLRLIGAVQGRS